jgi:hypothetical protein
MTKLSVIKPASPDYPPPRPLGPHGLVLWNAVQSEHVVDDVGGVEVLMQACGATDRLASLTARIAEDGEMLVGPSGLKPHPALSHELATRSFIVRMLGQMGFNFEPLRPTGGRPPKAFG